MTLKTSTEYTEDELKGIIENLCRHADKINLEIDHIKLPSVLYLQCSESLINKFHLTSHQDDEIATFIEGRVRYII